MEPFIYRHLGPIQQRFLDLNYKSVNKTLKGQILALGVNYCQEFGGVFIGTIAKLKFTSSKYFIWLVLAAKKSTSDSLELISPSLVSTLRWKWNWTGSVFDIVLARTALFLRLAFTIHDPEILGSIPASNEFVLRQPNTFSHQTN